MCQCIYLGSSIDLGESPYNPEAPGFYYRRFTGDEQQHGTVVRLLELSHLYFLGGSQGCSCTLSYTGPWENAPELNAERETAIGEVAMMLEFLRAQLDHAELRLLCTWWDVPPEEMGTFEQHDMKACAEEFQFPLDRVLHLRVSDEKG